MPAELVRTSPLRVRVLRGQADGSRWDMAVRPPAARLRPYVRGDYVGYTECAGATDLSGLLS